MLPKRAAYLLLVTFIPLLVACNKTQLDATSTTQVTFESSNNEVIIAGKSFVMDQILISLDDIRIFGESIQQGPVDLKIQGNTNSDFLNSTNGKSVEIPVGTYPEMNFTTAVVSNGAPSVIISGIYYLQNGNTYNVEIALVIDQEISSQLLDTDGSTTILIEEGTAKNISVQLDTEILFSDLIPGLWNAAAVTSNNGSETIQVDALNNTNIYNAISGKIGESFKVKFE